MNKRIAPTIVVVIVVLFILVQTGILIYALTEEGLGLFWKLVIVLVPLGIIVALFSVYRERLKEIKDEENDDLSRY